jgi:hypothetical protein
MIYNVYDPNRRGNQRIGTIESSDMAGAEEILHSMKEHREVPHDAYITVQVKKPEPSPNYRRTQEQLNEYRKLK